MLSTGFERVLGGTHSKPTDTRYCSISRTMSWLVRSKWMSAFFGMTAVAVAGAGVDPVVIGAANRLLLEMVLLATTPTPFAVSLLPFCALLWPLVSETADGSSRGVSEGVRFNLHSLSPNKKRLSKQTVKDCKKIMDLVLMLFDKNKKKGNMFTGTARTLRVNQCKPCKPT